MGVGQYELSSNKSSSSYFVFCAKSQNTTQILAKNLKRVAAKLGFEKDCCWVNNGGDAAESLVEVGTMAHQYHQQKVCKERMGN